ncbi:MAG: acetyl-CoA hydrolase/transferase family protein [Ignavibacteriaceae bacterium]|nr:acetyl-CoA hydrolase/transferase family protein [Ignavibacteriaceae bacterium]
MIQTKETMQKTNYASNYQASYKSKLVNAEEAMSVIKTGDKVVVHSNCAVPMRLIDALVLRKNELFNVEMIHVLSVGKLPYLSRDMEGHFRHKSYFMGADVRKAVAEGDADFAPIFLFEYPLLFSRGIIKPDVALIHVSPPDEHGFCSYGVEVGITKTSAEKSSIVIAQVNPNMPRTLGDSFIHISKINYIVECDDPVAELPQGERDLTPEQEHIYSKIGEYIANLIEDGSTLQMGIGVIPDSVLQFLTNKKDIGIHSEMFSDGIIELVEKGILNNSRKKIHPGKIIAGFVLGTRRLYDFIDNNPLIEFHRQEYVNDPFVIAQNTKMVAINSAIEVDITGQVCSDSIGTRLFSGFGGQVDFIRGAARSEGGKPIIALPSSTKDGKISRIVPQLKPGAGVVTSRADVHHVVTEYGEVDLFGKSIRERVKALISIAHPQFRDELTAYAKQQKYL